MALPLVFLLVLQYVFSQECGSSPPVKAENMPPQKVAYVQIETSGANGYSATMKQGYDGLAALMRLRYPTSQINFFICNENNCLNGIDLATYTQVLVNDMSSSSDNTASHRAGYQKIAAWYTETMQKPHIICDGRIRSSLWTGRYAAFNGAVPISAGNRPNIRLWENYFVNLGVRGGGLFLGTDHAPAWTEGINEINKMIAISQFANDFDAQPYGLEVDEGSPVMTYPRVAADFSYQGKQYLWDDSSTADAPISEQRNGLILYPIGWHGSIGFNRPGVSTTIRGTIGFLVEITTPSCGALILGGTSVTFTARRTSGTIPVADKDWTWTSNVDGVIGSGPTFSTSRLTPGQHIVTVRAKDNQGFIATAKVVIFITFSSGKSECIVYGRDGKQVQEYFPIQRAQTPIQWYSYGTPVDGSANTRDKIEAETLSANIALYDDSKGLHLIWVNSKNVGPATITVGVSVSDVTTSAPLNPTLELIDDPNDRFLNWNPATRSGTATFQYQASTKGFIIGPFTSATADRWCINLDVNVASITGLHWINTWGHVKNSDMYPSPQRLASSTYGATTTKKFQFCRAQCTCGGVETRSQPVGTIEPVRVNQGAGGSIGDVYTKGLICTWAITPKDAAGNPATGIVLWWTPPFNVATVDSVNVYQGELNGPIVYNALKGNTVEPAKVVTGPKATVLFTTTDALKTQFGWVLNYALQPTLLTVSPNKGTLTEANVVTLTGASFVNNPNFRVRVRTAGGQITDLIPSVINTNSVVVSIPPGAVGTAEITVTNDYRSGIWAGPVGYSWYDASCGAVKTCAGCTVRPECAWCNTLNNPNTSFCLPNGGNIVCPAPNPLDKGCCTQCLGLNKCSNGGACRCDDTCKCDAAHWGADCSCLQCPIAPANKQICSGNGKCGCDGKCACAKGWRGPDCSCKTCEGEPAACSGHGTCNCDGTCTCKPGWTHAFPFRQVCDCSTECPGGCSGHGVCKCGVCECEPSYKLLPDCSCKDCDMVCGDNQVCNCKGMCECVPGLSGDKCDVKSNCGKSKNCEDCVQDENCGWCDGANVCENKFELDKCSEFDNEKNPRGFFIFTKPEECAVSPIGDKESLADSKTEILVAAIVGSLGTAALGLLAMAYFMRPEAMAPGMMGGDLGHLGGEMFIDSAIHQGAAVSHTSAVYTPGPPH